MIPKQKRDRLGFHHMWHFITYPTRIHQKERYRGDNSVDVLQFDIHTGERLSQPQAPRSHSHSHSHSHSCPHTPRSLSMSRRNSGNMHFNVGPTGEQRSSTSSSSSRLLFTKLNRKPSKGKPPSNSPRYLTRHDDSLGLYSNEFRNDKLRLKPRPMSDITHLRTPNDHQRSDISMYTIESALPGTDEDLDELRSIATSGFVPTNYRVEYDTSIAL